MQETIVALIVLCAAWSVAMRYLPKGLRRAFRAGLARIAQRAGWQALARRLAAAPQAAASCSDGCGSCGGCDDETDEAGDRRRTARAGEPQAVRFDALRNRANR